MDERHVVTCFLLHRGLAGDRVLLVRRSDRVGTYRGRWAAISGTVDSTPDRQALVEIAEETGLAPGQVRLLASGAPLIVDDPALARRWVVHPYLFAIDDPAAVRLEWEHTEARWVSPEELGRFETVPQLAAALASVYPPAGASGPSPAAGLP
jgi:8-oxo-dGTP pyrophosphatase MutT (NUDIX family)